MNQKELLERIEDLEAINIYRNYDRRLIIGLVMCIMSFLFGIFVAYGFWGLV